VDEVAPGVFVATAARFTTTTTVVAGEGGGCLVVDPAVTVADLAALARWLAARGLRPVAAWSTHPHWDHMLWSRALGDVVRYATEPAVARAARDLPRQVSELSQEAPGHDLSLFARLTPLSGTDRIPWAGPAAVVVAHDGHAPGHGAVFLPGSGVLIAGDMCSDIEIPLLDLDSADPFGAYRRGLGLLAALPDVRVVVPGHGHAGDRAAFRRRIAADAAYLDAVRAGGDPDDPRLGADGADWLRAEHNRQRARAAGA
jgi:hydroxyacylglutathione hydrolase